MYKYFLFSLTSVASAQHIFDAAASAHADRIFDNGEERRVILGSEAHAARTLGEAVRSAAAAARTLKFFSPTFGFPPTGPAPGRGLRP